VRFATVGFDSHVSTHAKVRETQLAARGNRSTVITMKTTLPLPAARPQMPEAGSLLSSLGHPVALRAVVKWYHEAFGTLRRRFDSCQPDQKVKNASNQSQGWWSRTEGIAFT
jgi:hypothetical protein